MFFRCGNDLLSHVLRRSTISAVALNGRVRDGIGCFAHAMITTPNKHRRRKHEGVSAGWEGAFAKQMRSHSEEHLGASIVSHQRSIAPLRSTGWHGTFALQMCSHTADHRGEIISCPSRIRLMLWCVYILTDAVEVSLLLDQIKPIGPLVPVN